MSVVGLLLVSVGISLGWAAQGGPMVPAAPPGATTSDAAPLAGHVAAQVPPEPPRPGAPPGVATALDRRSGPGADTTSAVAAPTPPLARFEDLVLHLPSGSPVVVGFHEAATTVALGLEPVGVLTEDRNTTRTELPADTAGGTPYLVLTSRGRAAAPTSAMDVVLEPDDPVLAPVSGTVVDVRAYLLYGAHTDLRVEIRPDDRPDLRVVLIHLDEVAVGIGDRVTGGVSPLAGSARSFPFGSHIDRETEPDRYPHVHVELQAEAAARLERPPADGPPGRRGPTEEAGT